MRVVKLSELKFITERRPFYTILQDNPVEGREPRAIGCGPLAALNFLMLVQSRLGASDNRTVYEFLQQEVLSKLEQKENLAVSMDSVMAFLESSSLLNGWRALVLNPSAMNMEIFWEIALRRIDQGDIIFALLSVPPTAGEKGEGKLNHISVIHGENGEVYYDGLRMTQDTLSNILYFCPLNTLFFFSPPSG